MSASSPAYCFLRQARAAEHLQQSTQGECFGHQCVWWGPASTLGESHTYRAALDGGMPTFMTVSGVGGGRFVLVLGYLFLLLSREQDRVLYVVSSTL